MKTALLLTIILCIFACTKQSQKSGSKEYLELTEAQLRDIGFVINDRGIFFKSEIPESDIMKTLNSVRCYLNTYDAQGTEYIMGTEQQSNEERLKKVDHPKYQDSLPAIKSDYYFVKIVEVNGGMICSVEPHKVATIPLLVKQGKYNFKIKKDVIVYMKDTKGLREKLSYVKNLDEYVVKLDDK
jgi:hypothetical protein